MIKDLIIYQKVYDLILYVFPIVNKFPKSQRFVLGQQIQNTMVDIAKLIVEANKSRNKTRLLFQLDVELEKLRLLLRLAKDMKFMGLKQYEITAGHLSEIGKLLGGWMKASR